MTSTSTTAAKRAPKCAEIVHFFTSWRDRVFHPENRGVPVVVRPSGENFPSPFNQFQSIGQKKIRIPIPRLRYATDSSFVPIVH